MYVRFLSTERPFFCNQIALWTAPAELKFLAWVPRTLSPVVHLPRSQLQAWIPHLSASPDEGLNSSAAAILPHQNWGAKIGGKTPKIRKHEIDLSGQINVVEVVRWGVQFHLMMNANKSAGRITGLHSSILAYSLENPLYRLGRFAAGKPAGEQTGQNMYISSAQGALFFASTDF